jgi:hypothetical protein
VGMIGCSRVGYKVACQHGVAVSIHTCIHTYIYIHAYIRGYDGGLTK